MMSRWIDVGGLLPGLLALTLVLVSSGCAKTPAEQLGETCSAEKDCPDPLACYGQRCLWPGSCVTERYKDQAKPGNLESRTTKRFDPMGRRAESRFERIEGGYSSVETCAYDAGKKARTCVRSSQGTVVETTVKQYDAGDFAPGRCDGRTAALAGAICGREIHRSWRSRASGKEAADAPSLRRPAGTLQPGSAAAMRQLVEASLTG